MPAVDPWVGHCRRCASHAPCATSMDFGDGENVGVSSCVWRVQSGDRAGACGDTQQMQLNSVAALYAGAVYYNGSCCMASQLLLWCPRADRLRPSRLLRQPTETSFQGTGLELLYEQLVSCGLGPAVPYYDSTAVVQPIVLSGKAIPGVC